MRGKNVIFINGQHYDAVTGLPVDQPSVALKPAATRPVKMISDFGPATKKPAPVVKATPATPRHVTSVKEVHAAPQRSKTLRRDIVKRPAGTHEIIAHRDNRQPIVVGKSPAIRRFASHPLPRTSAEITPQAPSVVATHKPVTIQPVAVQKVHALVEKKTAPAPKARAMSSRELKEHLIAQKLAEAKENKKEVKQSRIKKALAKPRVTSIVAASIALVVLGGYLTYLNMPNLSVRVAAAQAGIDASFPEYRPDGYHFNGPIAYAPGEVTMKFQSNGGNKGYEITQKSSSWDSQAVLDNYVAKQTDSYLTYSEQGLTIYTYGSQAAWVNGGVLYTLEGNAPLSNEQVLRIAASM